MSLLIILSLPLIVGASLIVLARPYVGVLLIILLQVPMAPSTKGLTLAEIAFLFIAFVTIFSWFTKHFLLERKGIIKSKTVISILIFFSVLLTSLVYSVGSGIGLSKAITDASPFLLVLLAFVVSHEANTEKRVQLITICFLLASTLVVLQCLAISVASGSPFTNPLLSEANSPFNSPIYLFGAPVAIASLSLTRGIYGKGIISLVISLHAWRALVGFRRQPIFIFVIMILVIPYMVRRIRHPDSATLFSIRNVVIIGLFIIGMGAIATTLGENPIEQYARRFRPEYIMRGLGGRIGTNLIAFSHFMDSPFLGKGFGFDTNLTTLVSQVGLDTSKDYLEISLSEVHSLYFYALMHTGLLGFGAGLYLFFRVARDSFQTRITSPLYRHTHQWIAGGAGIFLTILLLGVLSIKSFSLEAWMAFGISLGILLRVRRIAPITKGVHQ